MLRYKTETRPG